MKADAQLAQRVYAALLHLYPADFRHHYGEELTLLFADMHRAAAKKGLWARVNLWLTVLLDLVSSAMKERIRTMFNSRSAAVLSAALCLPFLLLIFAMEYLPEEPAFLHEMMVESDGYTTTQFGKIMSEGLLLAFSVAFVINLSSMFTRDDPGSTWIATLSSAVTAVSPEP